MHTTCPCDDQLRRYALGSLEDALSDEIDQHLETCAACEETLSGFDAIGDSLTRHLPLVAAQGAQLAPEPPAWLERLQLGDR